ncbi:phage tail tape measure protein [Enterocloster clostridioformis]|uniref:Phage tail tape measure protein, TP901 family n=1 Tax=Enterocloster clostridioformis TaxID=1531 RepID=A0A2X2UEJ4_9FIRM|nr:phage tail tape measure protein [Enterocloster clostridioformis]MCA5576567.1 phage tail tape measure protein [Enterocloster clostridioformis]SQB14864.1 phage tail tape measure protein, TP901 family [Enterocloster clostridioformis]
MAGSQREYELLFKLKATLGGNFSSTFKTAVDTQKRLAESVKEVNSLQSKIDGYTKASGAIEKNRGKLSQLTAEHDRLQSELQETAQKKKALQKAMETAEADGNIEDYKRLQSELTATEREYGRLKEKLNGNKSQIQQTTATIEQQEKALEELGRELRNAGVNTDNLEGANKRLQSSYDKLKTSQENLQKINKEQAKIKQNISSTRLQLAGTIGAISTVATAFYAGPVRAAQGYETALAKVSTIADTQAVPLEKFSQEIMALSNTTGVAATAIAEDVYNAISAGQKSGDAVNFVANSTKLAKAGFAETSQTLDVLTTILNAYGMSADKVGTVSDMLVQIQNKGKVTVGELSSVMGKIIPTANSYNVSLEQLGATYAIMTSKGIAAAETTTYANSMLNELGKSGTTADKTLRKVAGSGFSDLMASGMSLGEVLAILQTEAEKSGKTLADMFGSAEAGKAAVSLLSNGVDGFNASVADMVNSGGMTDSAFALMSDTTEAKMAKAKNSITNLGIVLGQNLLPIVGNVADKVAVLVTKVSEFAQENPKLVQTVLKVAAGLAAFKVAGLGAKLGFLHIHSGIKTVQNVLELFKSRVALAEVASIGLGGKLKAAGGGVLSYFGNVKTALGGVGSALGNILLNNPLAKSAGGFFAKIGGVITSGAQGLAGKLLGPLSGVGSSILSVIIKPFSLLGGKLGGILSGLGGVIARSPLGTIGKFVASGIGKIGGVIAPIGNLLKTALGPLGKLGTTLLGPLGGIAGKLFPVIGIVTAVITAVQLLRNHFDEVRNAVGRIFGEGGLAVFDKIVSAVTAAGEAIKNVFSDGNLGAARGKIEEIFGAKGTAVFDGFISVIQTVQGIIGNLVGFITEHIVPVAEQVLSVIVDSVIPGILNGIQMAAPVIMQIVQSIADFIAGIIPVIGEFIAGIMPIISEIITFIQTYVFPIVQEIFNFIVAEVLPFISQGVQTLATTITTVLSAVLPVVQEVFSTIWNIISPILQQILTTVQAVLPNVLSVFRTVFSTIGSIIQAVTQIFSGLIQFITGVFSGNWSQAWNGIKTIFQGAWDGLTSIVKGVINGIIGIINGAISALNSIKIPDWVPGVGGKGINIPTLPTFAKGTRSTPDTFIAGEEGPELITNAPGRVVYTAAQTQQIMERSQQAAASVAAMPETQKVTMNTAAQVPQVQKFYSETPETVETNKAPEVVQTAGSGGGYNVTVNNNPTIVVNGDTPGDLEEKLEQNNQKLLREFEEITRQKNEDERRSEYE